MSNPSSPIDLGNLFQSVIGTLNKNKESLNKADTNNHDHGDNMVNAFDLIAKAIKEKQGADPAGQLAHAAEVLGQQKSGSAQLYAKGLSQAARQFQGKQVTSDNVMTLVPTLLGVGEAPVRQSSAYLMVSPANGAYVTGNSITFQWKATTGVTRHWLTVRRTKDNSGRISICLDTNRRVIDESDRITAGEGNVLSVTKRGFLNDGTEYKWNIAYGDNESVEPKDYWVFTNGATPPRQAPKQQQAQQQQDAGVGDIIGTLIRKAQNKPQQQQQPGEGVGDIIGSLIRKAQNKPQQQQQPGEGVGDIIGTLIRKAQEKPQQKSKSQTGINQKEIVDALVSNSPMGDSYRSQSGSLVANALIAAAQNMLNKK